MSTNCSPCFRRHGLTLIEVVTALAILSTLLVGMLVAFKKNADRIQNELAVRQATAAVDRLLVKWASQGVYPPERGHGTLPGADDFVWETRVVSRQYHTSLGLDIVSFHVRPRHSPIGSNPVITIELPVPANSDSLGEPTS